jgi:kynurenine formamidase
VLNAFKINYVVLHDSDIKPGMAVDAENTVKTANQKIFDVTKAGKLVVFPIKLEETVGYTPHFSDQYYTLTFFSDHANINADLEKIINEVLSKIGV